jgi:outer membrane protein TolC
LSDALSGAFAGSEFESRASALDAHRDALRDGIELEVLQAYQAAREGDIALEATKRELTSAEEAYRVGRELFLTGRVPSATLTDAETELTRARLDALNAKADARVARVRLAHALGRDARLPRP